MGKTLMHRLDDACERRGLEWLILPFDRESWRHGPFWCALVQAQYEKACGRASRFYRYNQESHIPQDRRPDPEVVYIALEPLGRREAKRLLLAQLADEN